MALLIRMITSALPNNTYMHGVNLGGWLVIEPSMFDQGTLGPYTGAELDVINQLRKGHGDAVALQTMKNHHEGFVPDAALDELKRLEINAVRIPVGYWMWDLPLSNGTSSYDYGFQHEGFVVGGLGALESTLGRLQSRGMRAVLDLHALPGCSSKCQGFAGMQCNSAWGFFKGNPSIDIGACHGASYKSTRNASSSWMELGAQYVRKIAAWRNAKARDMVAALTIANEPALNEDFADDIKAYYAQAVPFLAGLPLSVNLIGQSFNEGSGAQWVGESMASGALPTSTLVDYHHYYNWDGQHSAPEYNSFVCSGGEGWWAYPQKTSTFIGEWSVAVNQNGNLHDLTNPGDVAFMKSFFANQASYYVTASQYAGGKVVGAFYWNFRYGSGWDPLPTADAPHGRQTPGTSFNQSAGGYGFTSWNFLELAAHGVVVPLSSLAITGRCECDGCGGH